MHERTDGDVAEFGFGLSFELWFAQLHSNDCCDAFADVFAEQVFIFFFEGARGSCVFIEYRRECGFETLNVHAAFDCGNAVGITINTLVITRIPLQGYVDGLVGFAGLVMRHLGEQGFARGVEMLNEVDDSAFVLVRDFLFLVGALVGENNF